jgi:hypothetical protein
MPVNVGPVGPSARASRGWGTSITAQATANTDEPVRIRSHRKSRAEGILAVSTLLSPGTVRRGRLSFDIGAALDRTIATATRASRAESDPRYRNATKRVACPWLPPAAASATEGSPRSRPRRRRGGRSDSPTCGARLTVNRPRCRLLLRSGAAARPSYCVDGAVADRRSGPLGVDDEEQRSDCSSVVPAQK